MDLSDAPYVNNRRGQRPRRPIVDLSDAPYVNNRRGRRPRRPTVDLSNAPYVNNRRGQRLIQYKKAVYILIKENINGKKLNFILTCADDR